MFHMVFGVCEFISGHRFTLCERVVLCEPKNENVGYAPMLGDMASLLKELYAKDASNVALHASNIVSNDFQFLLIVL